MDQSRIHVFLNKLKLNKIFFEQGQSKIVIGKAKKEYGSFLFEVFFMYILGLIILGVGLFLLNYGRVSLGAFVLGVAVLIYAWSNHKSFERRKLGNKVVKVLEDNSITFIEETGKKTVNNRNLQSIIVKDTEKVANRWNCTISLLFDNSEYLFLELDRHMANIDSKWIAKFIADYLLIDHHYINQQIDKSEGVEYDFINKYI